MQEKIEIKEAQKKTEVQLLTITKLANNVTDRFINPESPCHEEGLSAVTLRFGTQLKGPTISSLEVVPTTHADVDPRGGVICEEEILARKKDEILRRTADPKNPTSLPYPIAAKKARKTKTTDPCVIELLKKVEVTLPLFEVIQQVPIMQDSSDRHSDIHDTSSYELFGVWRPPPSVPRPSIGDPCKIRTGVYFRRGSAPASQLQTQSTDSALPTLRSRPRRLPCRYRPLAVALASPASRRRSRRSSLSRRLSFRRRPRASLFPLLAAVTTKLAPSCLVTLRGTAAAHPG
ncbi:hypothetical protein PIB30_092687 [Stylosanthes scabra]|uniref:Uncharacterized protein n=1 Tax=Stylosanthes scabra TaxID=79078 RepID=A0ABU6SVC2_9FABA|nr:hypothetical protein [Stylosanthes scabra]